MERTTLFCLRVFVLAALGTTAINPTATSAQTSSTCSTPKSFAFTPVVSQVVVGTEYSWQVTAVDGSSSKLSCYKGSTAVLTISDAKALHEDNQDKITFKDGVATLPVTFMSPGVQTITVTDSDAVGTLNVTVVTSSAAALAGCGSCYASIGAGAEITGSSFGDYNNSANVLQSTHLGNGSPQFAIGVAYKLPIKGPLHKKLNCSPADFFNPSSEAKAAYCFPLKAFVSMKFTPDASQAFNGFTYGVSHSVHKNLDILFGISYSAFNEISPGFRAAAVYTVQTQQAAGNTSYAKWSVDALTKNAPTAYDGFPTQLIKPDGTFGAQIYAGNPLVNHFHSGFLIGVAVPLSFRSALSGGN